MAEFLAMGGYGAYVWSSYAIAALVLGVNAVLARRAERAVLHALAHDMNGDDDDATA